MLGMIIASFGYLPPVAGAISQEVIDVLAILNSLRILWPPRYLSDMPLYEANPKQPENLAFGHKS